LPDDVVLKVPVDDLEVPMLAATIGFAVEHGPAIGAAAQAYVEREHALTRVADAYARALEVAAGGDAVNERVLWELAEAAATAGVSDVSSLARAAVEAGIVA
jgi:hypothetical protein